LWGPKLWRYLDSVSDVSPAWAGKFLAFPSHPNDFDKDLHTILSGHTLERLKQFGGMRKPVYYDSSLQAMHHIHIPGDSEHRLLQHHYAFAFFANSDQQSFYKRFIRDYMRYKDDIQCSGADIVERVRKEAKRLGNSNGDYYAIHARRGDFQFKEVKLSAQEIVNNLKDKNGMWCDLTF
jgi:hypothetical protein